MPVSFYIPGPYVDPCNPRSLTDLASFVGAEGLQANVQAADIQGQPGEGHSATYEGFWTPGAFLLTPTTC